MGIGASIATKIGIPIAIAAVAGFILFTFKNQIGSAISGGAEVIGGAFTRPIAGFLQGIQSGLGGIPSKIEIPFPKFEFTLGGEKQVAGTSVFDKGFTTKDALDNLCKNSLGLLCFNGNEEPNTQETMKHATGAQEGKQQSYETTPSGGTNKNRQGQAQSKWDESLDPNQRFRILHGAQGIESRAEIRMNFPEAIGLFDLPNTPRTEFLPLSAAAKAYYESIGVNPRISGEL